MAKKGIERPPEPNALDEIKAVIGRAKQGDVSVLPRLRELLTLYPDLWRRCGDLALQCEMAWVGLASGSDLHLRECLLRQAEALREELGGPSPSPVERLLVERVVACWMQLHYFDALEAQSLAGDEKPRLANFRAKRQEQANRAYLGALAALTTLRKLLPTAPIKAIPISATGTPCPERNGHQRNGHASEMPPGVHNRLAGYFDEPPLDARKVKRKQEEVGMGVGD